MKRFVLEHNRYRLPQMTLYEQGCYVLYQEAYEAIYAAIRRCASELAKHPVHPEIISAINNLTPEDILGSKPLDMPLPKDIVIGTLTFQKGTSLDELVDYATRWHRIATRTKK
ncbi:MAG: hypothetical protein KGI54_14040 [Pseudomonadota bacterium]|nr:hypothetical protein [Pseudomonadota bacterium]